jgi:hypothetical protein
MRPAPRHKSPWDPVLRRSLNRDWRRWGTDRLVRTLIDVARGSETRIRARRAWQSAT